MIKSNKNQTFAGTFLLILVFAGMLLLANFLLVAKTEQALKSTLRDTALTATASLRTSLVEGYTLGIYPETILEPERLDNIIASSPRIKALNWYDTNGELVLTTLKGGKTPKLEAQQFNQLKAGRSQVEEKLSDESSALVIAVKNTFGQPIGYLGLDYQTGELQGLRQNLIDESLFLFPVLLSIGAFIFIALFLIGRKSGQWVSSYWNLTILSTLGMVALAVLMFRQAEPLTTPFLQERLVSIASAQEQLWAKAAEQGFTFDDFAPTTNYLQGLEEGNREVGQASVANGEVASGTPAIHVGEGKQIVLAPNPNFLRNVQFELGLDYLTLTLILFFFWAQFKTEPIQGLSEVQSSQVNRIKPLLFVFFLSEELIRPFLPVYAASSTAAWLPSLDAQWIPSLSISLFMAIVAFSQPFLTRINTFTQARTYWLIGCVLAALGQLVVLMSPSAEILLAGRVFSGMGYALCFVSGQCMLLMVYGAEKRTSAFANLVVCIMAATVVGPALGGLIADNLGQAASFTLAILAPLSAAVWGRGLSKLHLPEGKGSATVELVEAEAESTGQTAGQPARKAGLLSGIGHPKLLALTLFAAVPAKIMLTGLLFFLLPLMATNSDSLTTSDVGRVILIYGFLMLTLVPWFARQAQSGGKDHTRWFVAAGLLVASFSGVVPLLVITGVLAEVPTLLIALTVATALGLGQAIAISSQASMVQSLQSAYAPDTPQFSWLGTYRLVERLGNAAGPPLVAGLLLLYGTDKTLVIFGLAAAVCALLCMASLGLPKSHKLPQAGAA